MILLTLEQIATATGGRISGTVHDTPIREVCTDSRSVIPGSLFVALHGERFDAHDFLAQVAAAGASAALVHREVPGLPIPSVRVADTRKGLGQLGAFVRRQVATRIIAIGGSNGKTTTKHLVSSVLSSALRGTQSPKSFNNDIGVPLTLLGMAPGDDYAVLELGTNHPGELSPLSTMAQPDIVAITSIGPEHLEGFGDLDGVRAEEVSILDGLKTGGLCIANGDDALLPPLVRQRCSLVITFGFAPSNDLHIQSVDCTLEGIRFEIKDVALPFYLPLPGRHNASNALVALAIGREMGLNDQQIRDALANCSRPDMRMQVVKLGAITLLNDAYNANPASMQAALDTIASLEAPGRRVAVLGEMRELGGATTFMHKEIGRAAARCGLDLLICVGEAAKHTADAAAHGGLAAKCIHWVGDADAAAQLVPSLLRAGDTVLLKASRSIKLEKVADAIAVAATGNIPGKSS